MAFSAFLIFCIVLYLATFAAYHVHIAAGGDRLAPGESLLTNQTLTSAQGAFALGFFDSGDSSTHGRRFYLAIWYNNIPCRTVVWVANRNAYLTDPAGVATVAADGNLVALNGNSTVVWSSGIGLISGEGPTTTAVIEESGNLALKTTDVDGRIVWKSFDFPSDTMLPGMTLRMNLTTGKVNWLVSWSGTGDPSPGDYYFGPDALWPVQLIIIRRGARKWRSTMWNSKVSSDVTTIHGVRSFAMYLTVTSIVRGEMVWTQSISDASLVWRFQLNSSGIMELWTWLPEASVWGIPCPCRSYARCGPNGI